MRRILHRIWGIVCTLEKSVMVWSCLGIFFFSLLAYWGFHVPLPNRALIVMGIVGVMAGLPKNIWMRIVFISLLCGFALIEMRASDKDRARYEQQWEQARQQEHSDFQSMVRGLEDSNATNQQKFNATMQQMNSVLESTQVLTGLSKENLADRSLRRQRYNRTGGNRTGANAGAAGHCLWQRNLRRASG